MSAVSCGFLGILAVFPLLLPAAVDAHQLDEYLQSTLVDIDAREIRLSINLTPGAAIADRVLAILDSDHDGTISAREAGAYADLLRHDLSLRLDGQELALKLVGSNLAEIDDLRSGWGIIQFQYAAPLERLSAGAHQLGLENRHQSGMSVYLLNAALPKSTEIQIMRQVRNFNQSVGEIDFAVRRRERPSKAFVGAVAVSSVPLLALVVGIKCARKARRSAS